MRALGLLLVVWAAGCTSHACTPEGMPKRGVVERPADLLPLAKHAVKHDCSGLLYDMLSAATQDEYSYISFWAFWQTDYADQVRAALGDGRLAGGVVAHQSRQDTFWVRLAFRHEGRDRWMDLMIVPGEVDPDPDEPKLPYRLGLQEQGLLD